jgi:hypothetical protein
MIISKYLPILIALNIFNIYSFFDFIYLDLYCFQSLTIWFNLQVEYSQKGSTHRFIKTVLALPFFPAEQITETFNTLKDAVDVIWLPCAVVRWECTSASLVSVLSCWSCGTNLQVHCLSSLTGGKPSMMMVSMCCSWSMRCWYNPLI